MGQGKSARLSYMKKVFYFTHAMGLLAAALFPFAVSPLVGSTAFELPFIVMTVIFGYGVALSSYFFIRATLQKQLRHQLLLLEPLTGKLELGHESIESLTETLEAGVLHVQKLVDSVMETADKLVPFYRSLAQSALFLADRANDGLAAARDTRKDVMDMEG